MGTSPITPLDRVLERITVVLVRPRNTLNIGAVARAMVDFGFTDLRLVTDYPLPFQEARSAVDAASVLAAARVFGNVADAVADARLVYGTTALGERNLQHPVDVLRNAAALIGSHAAQPEGRVALLFGSEKTGLSNDELSHCHRLLTIPMRTAGVSMNLGQAVAVTLYELVRATDPPRMLPEAALPATAGDLARFEDLLHAVLTASGYEERHPGNLADGNLHRVVRRLALPAADMPGGLGMLRQILWKLRPGPDSP